jgi:lysozyme family protein
MSNSTVAIAVVQYHECDPRCSSGKTDQYCYEEDQNDLGGATKHGISLNFCLNELAKLQVSLSFPKPATKDDIKNLTRVQAAEIYLVCWWQVNHYERITSQMIASKTIDMAVNMGAGWAHTLVQKAANDCGANLLTDGALGPLSIAAINAIPDTQLVKAIAERQKERYEYIISKDPSQEEWRHDWMVRASWPGDVVGKLA